MNQEMTELNIMIIWHLFNDDLRIINCEEDFRGMGGEKDNWLKTK